jgi:hypothetical protein
VVGSLLWLALQTRPDIAHAANMRSRKVSKPTDLDWQAAKRVFRYLKGTAEEGLLYGGERKKGKEEEAVTVGPAFCDADWAGDEEDRKSTSGVLVKVNGCSVIWASRKQPCVALSTAEAEYVAAAAGAMAACIGDGARMAADGSNGIMVR